MEIAELRGAKRDEVLRIAARLGASNIRVFGSVARGEAGQASDVDILVDMEPGRSLFDVGSLQMDLEEALGARVQVVTERALHWYIRERVMLEAVRL
jgi:predicted nucleotidyltransferase